MSKEKLFCLWCFVEYVRGSSHARAAQHFCSKKCEVEARYWLFLSARSVKLLEE
jgi:hypothetical protein